MGERQVPFNLTVFNMPLSCEYFGAKITSTGLFTKDNPLRHPVPLLILQLGAILLISMLIHRLLRPFKQPRFVSDMLTGILLGPSLIKYIYDLGVYQSLFQGKQSINIDVLELLCHMYFTFLVGVRTDLGVIKTSGKRAWIIGVASFSLPIVLTFPAATILGKKFSDFKNAVDTIAVLESTTSFHVTAVLLGDLNLLNSEIGRLALSSSLISNLLGMGFKTMSAFVQQLVAAVVPSRLFNMPKNDALSLGLILSSQGFFDIMQFKRALRFSIINEEMFSVLTITAVLNSAIFTPLICYLYDPSKRYANYRRRTIQHAKRNLELRLLICLHEEESSFGVMNLLKASCPTRENPLGIYILDLMELSGREHPVLINHQFHKRPSSNLTRSDRIISSFRHFEAQNEGQFRNQYFTTITPYGSMHDDICTTALEKGASLIIIPYQRHESRAVKLVKRNVLDKAPCSVGFLIDKKILTYFVSDSIKMKTFNVCVIFFGGPDSREALAYGTRMVESPVTSLTVIRLIAEDDELVSDLIEAKIDLEAINELKAFVSVNDRIVFKEVVVQDGAETSKVLTSLEDVYDFILVGKRIDKDSSLVDGLTEWENQVEEELGFIGDILASSDMKSKASVLVLQQQSTVEDLAKKWD